MQRLPWLLRACSSALFARQLAMIACQMALRTYQMPMIARQMAFAALSPEREAVEGRSEGDILCRLL